MRLSKAAGPRRSACRRGSGKDCARRQRKDMVNCSCSKDDCAIFRIVARFIPPGPFRRPCRDFLAGLLDGNVGMHPDAVARVMIHGHGLQLPLIVEAHLVA